MLPGDNVILWMGHKPKDIALFVADTSDTSDRTVVISGIGGRTTISRDVGQSNLAARLASHAKGGDILIGEKTKRLIDGLWPLYERGLAKLKGIEEPLRIFSLLRNES